MDEFEDIMLSDGGRHKRLQTVWFHLYEFGKRQNDRDSGYQGQRLPRTVVARN